MFGFGKQKMGFGVNRPEPEQTYDGTGIWYKCPDCETPHPIKETQEFRDLVEEQCEALCESSQVIYDAFNINDPNGRWDVVPDQARFTFTNADGRQCHARYGVIGSWNPNSHSWMWAWHFPNDWMPAPACAVAHKLHAFGEARDWQALTQPLLYLDNHEAWHMAKLAAYVAGYPMVYSAMVNEVNRHFFAVDRPVWLTA